MSSLIATERPGFYLAALLDTGEPSMAIQDDKSVANRLFFRLFQASNILQKQTVSQVGLSTVQWAVLRTSRSASRAATTSSPTAC